ncbi:hypothetical protein [Rufibacter quisquiliarum]|uniref:DNA alkylation repair enzyme n=1 Tax=Rufibacter quisquiliarum TaxID=1549639 RepID=A0A839GTE9_9BACT|nr:hypothetical protein [Rufibacter quisquiliarum]MBA9077061.1 hypothetical protein [Rufibacter quisquiliarum]
MTTTELISALAEGKSAGKGRADEVAAYLLQQGQEALEQLWPGLYHTDAVLRARAAHVVEAVAKQQPLWLQPYRKEILHQLAQPNLDPAFNYCLPALLGQLSWEEEDLPLVIERLEFWLQHLHNQFVKAICLQSLTDLSMQQPWLQQEVLELIHQHMAKGGKAINARGRLLLKQLQKQERLVE